MFRTITLTPSTPPRAKLGGPDKDIPILSFVPPMEGTWDIYAPGSPAEAAAWLRQLAEQASDLAYRVERRAAQEAALATYPEAVA